LFKSFYEKVRVKVACRSPFKIPSERLFEMDKKMYMINNTIEGHQGDGAMGTGVHPDDDDQDDLDDEAKDDDEFDDLEDNQDIMDTDKNGESSNMQVSSRGFHKASGSRSVQLEIEGNLTMNKAADEAGCQVLMGNENLGKIVSPSTKYNGLIEPEAEFQSVQKLPVKEKQNVDGSESGGLVLNRPEMGVVTDCQVKGDELMQVDDISVLANKTYTAQSNTLVETK
jgi:hypothetical protein